MDSLYNIAVQTEKTPILGAGFTGLAAGIKTGFPIFEANSYPGGICYSYVKDGYYFEFSGGHWLFGGDNATRNFIKKLTPLNNYTRNSAVCFPEKNLYVPYPLQNNLDILRLKRTGIRKPIKPITFADQLEKDFGPDLCRLFFFPFNESYTAGLYKKIAPQDKYKNPRNRSAGYNQTFAYPATGLGKLIEIMAKRCRINYGKRVVRINTQTKTVYFQGGNSLKYKSLISTLPLNQMIRLTRTKIDEPFPPFNSTLIINMAAKRGKKCPIYHWLYLPKTKSGFYRVGFYSNVDSLFLPPKRPDMVSLYVELACKGNGKPASPIIDRKIAAIIQELKEWQFIEKPEVVDPTWVEIAYTWSWPGSKWREKALDALEKQGIHQIGRYGRWHFQGILESIKEGLSIKG